MKNESREAEIENHLSGLERAYDWKEKNGLTACLPAYSSDLRYLLDRNRELEALALSLAKALEKYRDEESAAMPGCRCGWCPRCKTREKAKETVKVLSSPSVAAMLSKAAKSQEVVTHE